MSREDFEKSRFIRWMSKEEKEWFLVSTPINRLCEYRPEQAVRKGWAFSIPEGDSLIDPLTDYQEALNLKQEVVQLFTAANQYGSAILVINADDGQPSDRPLDLENLRSIRGFSTLHCYQVQGDITAVNPLKPEVYQLIGGFLPETDGFTIHSSRVIRADGITIPLDVVRQNGGRSLSYPELIGPAYLDWAYTSDLLIEALEQQSLFVYERQGLIEALEDDILGKQNENTLRERLTALRANQKSYSGLAIDKEKEKIGYTSSPLQGLSNIPNHFKSELQSRSAVSGASHTELWKEGATGNLGAVGSAERQDSINAIAAFQETKLAPVLDQLYNLIFLCKDGPTGGIIPQGWTYEFNSLIEATDEEKLQKAKALAEVLKISQEMGWIAPQEARESLKHSGVGISFSDDVFEEMVNAQHQNNNRFLPEQIEEVSRFGTGGELDEPSVGGERFLHEALY